MEAIAIIDKSAYKVFLGAVLRDSGMLESEQKVWAYEDGTCYWELRRIVIGILNPQRQCETAKHKGMLTITTQEQLHCSAYMQHFVHTVLSCRDQDTFNNHQVMWNKMIQSAQ